MAGALAPRHREHTRLKTEAGRRAVILAAPLAKRLREHRLASRYKLPSDFVLANTLGRGLDYRDVGEGFLRAVKRDGLQAPGSSPCTRSATRSRHS